MPGTVPEIALVAAFRNACCGTSSGMFSRPVSPRARPTLANRSGSKVAERAAAAGPGGATRAARPTTPHRGTGTRQDETCMRWACIRAATIAGCLKTRMAASSQLLEMITGECRYRRRPGAPGGAGGAGGRSGPGGRGTGPDLGPRRYVMPKISTELSPEEHAALTRWISSAAVAAGIPGLDAGQAIHAMIKATVTDTTAAGVVLDLLRQGQG